MNRRAFFGRMLFAAAACAFFDVPLPEWEGVHGRPIVETLEDAQREKNRELAARYAEHWYFKPGQRVGNGVVTEVDYVRHTITIDWPDS